VLLTSFILLCSILTYVIPSGQYERKTVSIGESTRTIVVPGTYSVLEKDISLEGVILCGADKEKARLEESLRTGAAGSGY